MTLHEQFHSLLGGEISPHVQEVHMALESTIAFGKGTGMGDLKDHGTVDHKGGSGGQASKPPTPGSGGVDGGMGKAGGKKAIKTGHG